MAMSILYLLIPSMTELYIQVYFKCTLLSYAVTMDVS
jgi:hypothetical protein